MRHVKFQRTYACVHVTANHLRVAYTHDAWQDPLGTIVDWIVRPTLATFSSMRVAP